jgi:hypothetical protein
MWLMINSNIVISKLQGVCRIQSCDSPRGLEIIWGMSNTVISKLWDVCRTQSCDPPYSLEVNVLIKGEIMKPSDQYLILIVMSHWHVMVWIRIRDISMVLLLSILCGESCLFVSCCVGDRCDMTDRDEDLGRSRRLDAEDQRWLSTSRILGGRTIRRSGNVVCGLHHAQGNEERGFLGLTSNPRSSVSQFEPQNWQLRFGDLCLKITVTVS